MTPGYGVTFTVWCSPTVGTVTWPFTFTDGYIDKTFVKARYEGYDSKWYDVEAESISFASDYVLSISPVIPPCKMVEIYRDTPKDFPIVSYGNGNRVFMAESRSVAVRQALHVVEELKELPARTDLHCLCDCVEDV